MLILSAPSFFTEPFINYLIANEPLLDNSIRLLAETWMRRLESHPDKISTQIFAKLVTRGAQISRVHESCDSLASAPRAPPPDFC